MKGFKDFLFRGNIVDLAVAFVIGSAFAKLVSDFVSGVVTPILNRLGGGGADSNGLVIKLGDAPKTWINVSDLINAVVVFVLTALIVYVVFVLPLRKYKELKNGGPLTEDPTEVELLTEIRDSLRNR